MEFMKYRYKEIGERIKKFRGGLSPDELYADHKEEKKASIHANILSTLENGRVFQNNKSYLTKKVLSELSVQLRVNPRQIILGRNEDIERFVRELFYQVALNIDSSKDENNFAEILRVTYVIQKAMRWSGSLSYIMVPKNFQGKDYYGFDIKYIDNDIRKYYMFDKNPEEIYKHYLGILWVILRKEVTNSFITTIYPDENMSVSTKELDKNIFNWLSKGFINIVERTEEILRKSAFFSIGYEIYDLTSELRKIEKELLSNNDFVSIEYQSTPNYLGAKLNLMRQDFSTLDGRPNLKKFDFNEEHISKPMRVRTTKLIESFDIFLKQNLSSGEQMIIPNLLTEQSFLIQKERLDSYTQLAKSLIELQERYFQVIDLNEVSNLI